MKIAIGDLVRIPILNDLGIVVSIKEMRINEFDLHQDTTMLAEIYWQNMGKLRLEIVSDLTKLN